MDRLPLPLTLPFSPDLLWRYPLSSLSSSQQPTSPLLDVKTQLPGALGPDPRTWVREDVLTFLRWCEREFDLPNLELDKFQMNGKALCLLNKSDIAERAPGAGDVIHNALQLLLRDAPYSGRVPNSPLTPHGHAHSHVLSHALAAHQNSSHGNSHLLSPPNSARTPTSASWPSASPLFASADFHNLGTLGHLIQQTNSVTLSPAPSVDSNSQGGSPSHAEQSAAAAAAAVAAQAAGHLSLYTQVLQAHQNHHAANGHGGSNSGSQSDSEESVQDSSPQRSPAPSTPVHHNPPMSPVTLTAADRGDRSNGNNNKSDALTGSPGDGLDSGSNGRLLWDFLQQLLNDPSQRYSHYIAWKNRETGVFKITDPAGLARLWGIQKNHPSMNYDKMSRALRYYYRVNILRKVQGERHCYQFLRNPVELKSIKNISLLRHQMAAAAAAAATTTTTANSNGVNGAQSGSSKVADSTDASSERYSPSSSSNAAEDFDSVGGRNDGAYDHYDNDCDMPTDLSMESCERRNLATSYLSAIKSEKVAS